MIRWLVKPVPKCHRQRLTPPPNLLLSPFRISTMVFRLLCSPPLLPSPLLSSTPLSYISLVSPPISPVCHLPTLSPTLCAYGSQSGHCCLHSCLGTCATCFFWYVMQEATLWGNLSRLKWNVSVPECGNLHYPPQNRCSRIHGNAVRDQGCPWLWYIGIGA